MTGRSTRMSELATAKSSDAVLLADKEVPIGIHDVDAVFDQEKQAAVQTLQETGAELGQQQQQQAAIMGHLDSMQTNTSQPAPSELPTPVQSCSVSSITRSLQQMNVADTASQSCPREICQQWIDAAKAGDIQSLHSLHRFHPELLDYQPTSGLRCSALHWAAARGHADAVKHLLALGANPCLLTATGCSCLHSAAAANRQECVELLLQVPAVLQQVNLLDEDGLTAAALAAKHGHHMLQSRLLAAAALVGKELSQEQFHEAATCYQSPSQGRIHQQSITQVESSSTSMFNSAACQPGLQEDGSIYTAAAPSKDKGAPDGQWPQHREASVLPRAASRQSEGICLQSTGSRVGRGWLDAARLGDLQALQSQLLAYPQLLQYSGAGTSYAFTGNSALHWSAAKGHVGMVQWLLQQGADVHQVNQAGETALHTAVGHGQPACAEVLVLQGGADVQVQDGLGQSAIQLASAGQGTFADNLVLWELIARQSTSDRSSWSVQHMLQVLRLAGRGAEAATCVERQELVHSVQNLLDEYAARHALTA